MITWKGIIGASFSPATFEQYCRGLHWLAWRPSFVVLHNTADPSLDQRPNGFSHQDMLDLEHYYRDVVDENKKERWSAGPHLFIDDRQIWVFTPLTESGVHSPSWNNIALGVEMLGDYQREAFDEGRSLDVHDNTIAALATLHAVLGLDPTTLRLHLEDPLTTHHCPGDHVHKDEIIAAVQALLVQRHAGEHLLADGPP